MILIFGTSITWGAWDEKGGWAQRIKTYADKKAFSTNFQDYTAVYPMGVSGDNTVGLLKRFDTEVEIRQRDETKLQIIIEVGINDSYYFNAENRNAASLQEYQENILKLIEKSKKYNAELIFLGLTPVDERVNPVPWRTEISYTMKHIEKYEEVLRKTCAIQNITFIEIMNKFMEKDYKGLLIDGLHPNTEGHAVIYKQVIKHLTDRNYL